MASGEDLLTWIKQAGLVPDNVLNAFRKSAAPGELDAIAAQARDLRDWFKPFVYKHLGKPLEPRALRQLEPLNQLLARDEEFGQIVVHDRRKPGGTSVSGLAWRAQRRWRSPESLLIPLARSLADLVCTEDFTYVKACEGVALYASLRRSNPRPYAKVVQHGDLRQSGQAVGAPATCSASTETSKLECYSDCQFLCGR